MIIWENEPWYKMSLQLYPTRIVDLFVGKTNIFPFINKLKTVDTKKTVKFYSHQLSFKLY